jgi:hypothetical protein
VAFAGEWDTQGRLLDGPCRDFNVMSDRARVRHQVRILRPGPQAVPLPAAPTLLVYCAVGEAELTGGAEWPGERIRAGELLRIDDAQTAGLRVAAASSAALVLAELHPR